MKRKMISFFITVVMLFSMLPATAFAETKYGVWVGGKQITSDNAADVLGDGTVSFERKTNTLILDNAALSDTYLLGDIYCGIYCEGDLNIQLKGESRIYLDEEDKSNNGIRVYGDINFEGEGQVIVRARGSHAKGIWSDGIFSVKNGASVHASGLDSKKSADSGAVWAKKGIKLGDKVVESFEYSKVIEYLDESENEYYYVFSPDKEIPSLRVKLDAMPVFYSGDENPDDALTMRKIIVLNSENGEVKIIGMGIAGTEVRVEVTPNREYILKDFILSDTSYRELETRKIDDGKFAFIMPNYNVYIRAQFVKENSVSEQLPFTDVDENEWYGKAIKYVYENDLIAEKLTDKFNPDATATRAMIVSMLWKAEGMPLAEDAGFTDVKEDAYYKKAVDWAKKTGVSVGYGSTFGPDDSVTREQMVSMLYRYAVLKGMDVSVGENTNILSFEDAFSISEYAFPAMQWACGSGIIAGDGAVLFPQGTATRAQLSQVVMMLLG